MALELTAAQPGKLRAGDGGSIPRSLVPTAASKIASKPH